MMMRTRRRYRLDVMNFVSADDELNVGKELKGLLVTANLWSLR